MPCKIRGFEKRPSVLNGSITPVEGLPFQYRSDFPRPVRFDLVIDRLWEVLFGVWKVAPIITYQVQQQEAEFVATQAGMTQEVLEEPLVKDAFAWWSEQVESHQRIIELTHSSVHRGSKVSFEIRPRGGTAIAPGVKPDLLVVTAIRPDGKKEVVSVPVNEDAMSPSQYLRFKLNAGVFADLPDSECERAEVAVERYINRDMVPRVPSLIVRPDMSLMQLHEEVAL